MTIGIVSVAVNLGFAAGPPALGAFVDYFGNYQYGFMAYTVVALVGFALMLPIKPRFWTPPSKRKREPEAVATGKLQPAAV
jgi:MFS family permease